MKELAKLTGGEETNHYPAPNAGLQPPSTEVRGYLPEFEEVVDLHDYLDILFRRKWIILAFLVCVFVSTLIVTLAMKPVYKAEGRLEFNIQAPKVTKFQDVVESQFTQVQQIREFMQTQVSLLKSVSLAQRVIQKLKLDHVLLSSSKIEEEEDTPKEGTIRKWSKTFVEWLEVGNKSEEEVADLTRLDSLRVEKKTEKAFFKKLDILPERDTTIVKIAFNFTDPALTRNVVNTLIQEFISWRMDTKIDSANTAKQQLEKQIQLARVQLERSETKLNEFAQKAGIVSLEPNLNLIYKQLEETNKALAEVRTRRMGKEAAYRQAEEGDTASLPQAVDSKLIQDLRKSYIDLLGLYEEQSTTFGENYPKLQSLKAKMQDTQKKISRKNPTLRAPSSMSISPV